MQYDPCGPELGCFFQIAIDDRLVMNNNGVKLSCQDETGQRQVDPDHATPSEQYDAVDDPCHAQSGPDISRAPGQRGRQKRPTKVLLTMRFSREVLDYFKASGEGWQTRINEVLCHYVKQQQSDNFNSPNKETD